MCHVFRSLIKLKDDTNIWYIYVSFVHGILKIKYAQIFNIDLNVMHFSTNYAQNLESIEYFVLYCQKLCVQKVLIQVYLSRFVCLVLMAGHG